MFVSLALIVMGLFIIAMLVAIVCASFASFRSTTHEQRADALAFVEFAVKTLIALLGGSGLLGLVKLLHELGILTW